MTHTDTLRHVKLVLCCPTYLSVTHRHTQTCQTSIVLSPYLSVTYTHTHRHVTLVLCCPPHLSVTHTDTHTDMSD